MNIQRGPIGARTRLQSKMQNLIYGLDVLVWRCVQHDYEGA